MILREDIVLQFYVDRIDGDKIEFLKKRSRYKEEIRELIIKLKNDKGMNNKINTAKKLWKRLFEAAMSFIDADKRGYDQLFAYFDNYVEFEELIFASDSFYRDHTLHCLWVYFLGEYIRYKEEFHILFHQFEENNPTHALAQNIVKSLESIELETMENSEKLKELKKTMNNMVHVQKYYESIRCLSALTHDLGYPLKKIHKINKSINEILPYFSISDFQEYNFGYTDLQQNYIEELIRSMCLEMMITVNADGKHIKKEDRERKERIYQKYFKEINSRESLDVLSMINDEEKAFFFSMIKVNGKIVKRKREEMVLFDSFECYSHGIMSAYLLCRTVKGFTNSGLSIKSYTDVNFENKNWSEFFVKQDILKAVTNHTVTNYKISYIEGPSDFLILMDEIEEFSRISRANKNRQFVQEFCKSDIFVEDGYFNINFIFDSLEIANLDPEFAFKGRCKRFLKLFDIANLDEKLKIKLRCIGDLPYDKNVYELEIRKKYANVMVNGEEKDIPTYLKSNEFYSKDEYMEA